jgi:hypothetical protein
MGMCMSMVSVVITGVVNWSSECWNGSDECNKGS